MLAKGIGIYSLTIFMFITTYLPCLTHAKDHGGFAVGVPGDIVSGGRRGGVNILPGESTIGFDLNRDTYATSSSSNFAELGHALAVADFNGDGFPDLAIGDPMYDSNSGTMSNAGAVMVYWGLWQTTISFFPTILTEYMFQNEPGSVVEEDDNFGSSLAAGDFNNDGYDDLAIGIPRDNVSVSSPKDDAGAVDVIYGGEEGFHPASHQVWNQDSDNINGAAEAGDQFGYSLATGDFNGDGFDDLAIGAPLEKIGPTTTEAGAVNVIYGSKMGLLSISFDDNLLLYQGLTEVLGESEVGDHFGFSLAAGDFRGNGIDDLAIGIVGKDISTVVLPYEIKENAGAVMTLSGTESGLSLSTERIWSQLEIITGNLDANDSFGYALATGDMNGDTFDELVIGVPGENIGGKDNSGGVNVIYGSIYGLTHIGNWLFGQSASLNPNYQPQAGNNFGRAIAMGDINGDRYAELAIGAPFADVDAVSDGMILVIHGQSEGVYAPLSYSQYYTEMVGTPEDGDFFGWALVYIPPPKAFPWPMFMPGIITNGR